SRGRELGGARRERDDLRALPRPGSRISPSSRGVHVLGRGVGERPRRRVVDRQALRGFSLDAGAAGPGLAAFRNTAEPLASGMVTWDDVVAAAERLQGVAPKTPVMTSTQLDSRLSAKAFLKCESFQRVGAFKFRGAYNAISRIPMDERARGVV